MLPILPVGEKVFLGMSWCSWVAPEVSLNSAGRLSLSLVGRVLAGMRRGRFRAER